jgi:hypothetical protein
MHDGARAFITLIYCICADGTALVPTLIYPSDSGKPLDTWTQDLEEDDKLFMGCSDTGWSCNAFGLEWLKKVFIPHVRRTHSARQHVLLIVDGHSSYVNFAFIEYVIAHRIALLILPPYTTYRLQPLDVGIFGPLAHFFSEQIRALLNRGDGLVRSNKALFYKLFKPAFKQALTELNIKSSFAKCGIWPHDPTKVTSQLKKEEERPVTPEEQEIFGIELQTPLTVKSLRRFHLDF